jgi:hypothetical protein
VFVASRPVVVASDVLALEFQIVPDPSVHIHPTGRELDKKYRTMQILDQLQSRTKAFG